MPRVELSASHPAYQEDVERAEFWTGAQGKRDRPGSVKDMQAFAKQTRNELISSSEAGGEYVFMLRKH